MVTQLGLLGTRRAWPRALLPPLSFLVARAPCRGRKGKDEENKGRDGEGRKDEVEIKEENMGVMERKRRVEKGTKQRGERGERQRSEGMGPKEKKGKIRVHPPFIIRAYMYVYFCDGLHHRHTLTGPTGDSKP